MILSNLSVKPNPRENTKRKGSTFLMSYWILNKSDFVEPSSEISEGCYLKLGFLLL